MTVISLRTVSGSQRPGTLTITIAVCVYNFHGLQQEAFEGTRLCPDGDSEVVLVADLLRVHQDLRRWRARLDVVAVPGQHPVRAGRVRGSSRVGGTLGGEEEDQGEEGEGRPTTTKALLPSMMAAPHLQSSRAFGDRPKIDIGSAKGQHQTNV